MITGGEVVLDKYLFRINSYIMKHTVHSKYIYTTVDPGFGQDNVVCGLPFHSVQMIII